MRPNKFPETIVLLRPSLMCFVMCLCYAGATTSAAGGDLWPTEQSVTIQAQQTSEILPTVDGKASSSDGINFVITDGENGINVQRISWADIDRRGLLEFDTSQIPLDASIESASLELQINTFTYSGDSFPVLELHGYPGDGVLDPTDAIVPFNLIGSSDPIGDLGLITVNLDTNYIESLLGTATHLALLVYPGVEDRQTGFYTVEAVSFANPPKLIIQYIYTAVQLTGEIHGMKFIDLDGDGLFEPEDNETGLEGWTIYVDLDNDSQLDPEESFGVTDADGNYAITELSPGTYTVAEVPQDDWQQTFPTDNGTHVTTVPAGQIVEGIDFGNRFLRQSYSIDPTPDALASSTDGGSFITTDGQTSINVQRFSSGSADHRGILEFDLSQLPHGVPIASANLELQVWTITYYSDGTTTTYPVLEVHGYPGNGVAEVADATVPFNLIGSSDPIEELGLITINLDTNYIESLLGTATHLGLLVYPGIEGLQTAFWASEAASFANSPKLTIHYLDEPVCGDANHPYPIGDLNQNCYVNWGDFSLFAAHWLDTGCVATTWCGGADLDGSSQVDWADFSIFAAHWLECTDPSCGCQTPSNAASFAQQVLTLTNAERANVGLAALTWDNTLAQVAGDHACDMIVRNFFAHTNPDGQNVGDRATAAGYTWIAIGENLAAGHQTPAAAVAGWMNSPGHKANILNASFTALGVGYREGGSLARYWVQVFATPP